MIDKSIYLDKYLRSLILRYISYEEKLEKIEQKYLTKEQLTPYDFKILKEMNNCTNELEQHLKETYNVRGFNTCEDFGVKLIIELCEYHENRK